MAFGQQSGPAAGARQIEQLLQRVKEAGFADFREARHPLGLTQRQAGGRFTRDEVDELIERLEMPAADASARTALATTDVAVRKLLATFEAEQLAFELERRGWIVIAP